MRDKRLEKPRNRAGHSENQVPREFFVNCRRLMTYKYPHASPVGMLRSWISIRSWWTSPHVE